MNSLTIPEINVSDLGNEAGMRSLDAACRNWGIFQVVDHGIEPQLLKGLLKEAAKFFHQPSEKKRELNRSLENHWGFYDQELTKNTLDQKEVYDYGPEHDDILQPQWPTTQLGFKKNVLATYDAFEQLAFKILQAMIINLGETMDSVTSQFEPQHTSYLRLNYYPKRRLNPSSQAQNGKMENELGINPHTDAGAVTVLLQDQVSGLEVYKTGKWHKMLASEEALLINIGDVMQVWSNDRYLAPLHRVFTDPAIERFSVPFFLNPAYQGLYQPLPATVTTDNPPRYKAINWRDFREQRAAGDYADFGEEVQISHYLVLEINTMAFISTIPADQAKNDVLAMYQQLQGNKNYLPNYAKVFCHRPNVMKAWTALQDEIKSTMEYRRYELIILAVAKATGNSYCALTHGSLLARKFYDTETVHTITEEPENSVLSEAEKAMVALSQQVAINASAVTESDIRALQDHGFTDAEIFDVVTAAAARCFFPKIPDALGVQPDSIFSRLDPTLKEVLTVGREIDNIEPKPSLTDKQTDTQSNFSV